MEDYETFDGGSVEFTAGATLRLTLTWDDDRGTSVVELPRPRAGYGGHDLVIARDARCIALFLHSGQSQVGFEVFEIGRRLHPMFSLPYVLGESAAPKFTEDGVWLVMLVRSHGRATWYEEGEDWKLAWAELYVLHLPTLALTCTKLEVAAAQPPENVDWPTFNVLEIVGDDRILLELPWKATAEIDLPARDVTLRLPAE